MFKDARVLDTKRTAAAFESAYRTYTAAAEKWFDGSVGSVDRRMAACDRLLHSANSTVARMPVSESQRYLRTAGALTSDRVALENLREAMLTGASSYAEQGPPGYREAKPKAPGTSAGSNEFEHPAPRTKHPRWMDEGDQIMKAPKASLTNLAALHQGAHWFKDDGSYAVPNDGGPHPRDYSSPHEYLQARNMHDWIGRSTAMTPGGGDVAVDESWRSPHPTAPGATPPRPNPTDPVNVSVPRNLPRSARLAGADRRWVTLESAKFIAANGDCLDDSAELATRAHNHASVQTSTFTGPRSRAVTAAFVEQVVELGRKTYRPPVRTAALEVPDIAPEAIFL